MLRGLVPAPTTDPEATVTPTPARAATASAGGVIEAPDESDTGTPASALRRPLPPAPDGTNRPLYGSARAPRPAPTVDMGTARGSPQGSAPKHRDADDAPKPLGVF